MLVHPLVVLNVAGLTSRHLGDCTPNLQRLARRGGVRPLETITPAVTCPVQSTLLTGALPREHGIVANGWYFHDLSEIWFWRQSNRLVHGEQLWDAGRKRDPAFTCANICWWYNMYSSVDIAVTPRPMYPADGRKIPDCYTNPPELRDELTARCGRFPLFKFWGPATAIDSSTWITRAATHVRATRKPTVTIVYLPHLDYVLQREGPFGKHVDSDLRGVDALCGELIEDAKRTDANVIVLSEYGITPVARPVHINRALRKAGLIRVREELGREQLDAGASAAFAVADHQIAHVYVSDKARTAEIKSLLEALPGVERLLDDATKGGHGLDHPRSGELVAIADAGSWFTYYYWLDDDRAPDYARTVDIHRKPGYDPVELFLDPALRIPALAVGWRVAKRSAGFRTLLDVIPLDATLVKGSHGRPTDHPDDGPLFITTLPELLPTQAVSAAAVKDLILTHVFAG
jgi:predicted AlkP superfamily pyrophosphatase or phosphodiesterase